MNHDLVVRLDVADETALNEPAKLVELTFELIDDPVTNGVFEVENLVKA